MKTKNLFKMTRLQFTCIIILVLLLILFAASIKTMAEIVIFGALTIIVIGILPFTIGIMIQFIFRNKSVPKYLPLITSFALLTYASYFSSKPQGIITVNLNQPNNLFKFIIYLVSIIVCVGFIQSGINITKNLYKNKKKA